MERYEGNLNAFLIHEKSVWKSYIMYDSNYVIHRYNETIETKDQ